MRRVVITVVMAVALVCGMQTQAQYNREYFFWMGQRCMMDNNYREAIRTLNTLLRFDEDAYEGYFLRGIAHSSQHRRSISLSQGQFRPGIPLHAKSRRKAAFAFFRTSRSAASGIGMSGLGRSFFPIGDKTDMTHGEPHCFPCKSVLL